MSRHGVRIVTWCSDACILGPHSLDRRPSPADNQSAYQKDISWLANYLHLDMQYVYGVEVEPQVWGCLRLNHEPKS